jgi:hypothetical protein
MPAAGPYLIGNQAEPLLQLGQELARPEEILADLAP